MPLNLSALINGLPGAGGKDYPPTVAECAKVWADAVKLFAVGVVPPSTTVSAAAASLQSALVGAFSSPAAAPAMEAAFLAFATTMGGGMAGYVAVPPTAPVGFAQLFAASDPNTREQGIQSVANAIMKWAKLGTATLIAPPFTVLTWL